MGYKNKEDQARSARKYYEANKELCKIRATTWTNKHRKKCYDVIAEIKLRSGCVDCGYAVHPEALEFDHISLDKNHNVADLMKNGCSLARIMTEIDKCEIVCANCHRVRTFNRRSALKK